MIKLHSSYYSGSSTINVSSIFGFIICCILCIQIITGIILSFYYTPHPYMAFNSVMMIVVGIQYGWLLIFIHANCASFYMLFLYLHVMRGLYYRDSIHYVYVYLLWYSGFILFNLSVAEAFMGYVLTWGQMSFWGATVIINILTIIPFKIGNYLARYVWCTNLLILPRIYSCHFIVGFMILFFTAIHIIMLHFVSSNSRNGCFSN